MSHKESQQAAQRQLRALCDLEDDWLLSSDKNLGDARAPVCVCVRVLVNVRVMLVGFQSGTLIIFTFLRPEALSWQPYLKRLLMSRHEEKDKFFSLFLSQLCSGSLVAPAVSTTS